MKQQLPSPNFAILFLSQRNIDQTFFSQIEKIIDRKPIRGIIELSTRKVINQQVSQVIFF